MTAITTLRSARELRRLLGAAHDQVERLDPEGRAAPEAAPWAARVVALDGLVADLGRLIQDLESWPGLEDTGAISAHAPAQMRRPTPDELRELARAAGLTGGEAARLLDVHPRTWRKWVGGERPCPAAVYYALQVLTGATVQRGGISPCCWRLPDDAR